MSSITPQRKGVMCGSFASERCCNQSQPIHNAASEQRRGVARSERTENLSGSNDRNDGAE
jgi:hypothetical protein